MTQPLPLPPPQSGDDREDQAALIAAAVTAVFAAAEAALVASIASAVRRAVTTALAGATEAIGRRLSQQAASILAVAEQRATRIIAQAGLVPVPEAITEALESASEHAYEQAGSVYREAIDAAIEGTRGGLPYSSLSLSRIQAAQKALDDLLGKGITGYVDTAGRKWDLASYVEMATRTAVSNAYDEHLTRGLLAGGVDLVLVGTHSTEGSCPKCLPFENKLLSLTGATTGTITIRDAAGAVRRATVAAKAAGFRHPNCRHDLIPWHNGTNLATAEMFRTSPAKSEAEYKASQKTRALERRVRAAGRRHQLAITPQARSKARRDVAAARAASAAHRAEHGVRQTQVGVRRREHPFRAH